VFDYTPFHMIDIPRGGQRMRFTKYEVMKNSGLDILMHYMAFLALYFWHWLYEYVHMYVYGLGLCIFSAFN
jgi:hypothetical protein